MLLKKKEREILPLARTYSLTNPLPDQTHTLIRAHTHTRLFFY